MLYSNDDIRELCLDVDRILMVDNQYNEVTSLEDLQNNLRRKAKFKEIDFQSKCEGDNSLGAQTDKTCQTIKKLLVVFFDIIS